MHYFFVEKISGDYLNTSILDSREKNHIFKVLRAKKQSKICLFDGKGCIAEALFESKDVIKIIDIKRIPTPLKKLHLFIAPPRKNKMDQLLKQCSEIGICTINLLQTERSVAKPEKKTSLERMNLLLIEGCKQSHNPFLPTLNSIKKLSDYTNIKQSFDKAFYGATALCGKGTISNIDGLRNSQNLENIAWFVGPEGGFSDDEISFLKGQNVEPLQIGEWVMRVETAAIIGASTILNTYANN